MRQSIPDHENAEPVALSSAPPTGSWPEGRELLGEASTYSRPVLGTENHNGRASIDSRPGRQENTAISVDRSG
jgi:hypothetical protein